jgi:hypothetical protein
MITIHTLREATKIGRQKKNEELKAKANVWITETLFPELLETAKQGENSAIVVFPREISAVITCTLLRDMGFSCEGLDNDDIRYDDSKHEHFQAVVRWL